jgi:methylphosphotriester-DNA--protein-cysteine methyltransferase
MYRLTGPDGTQYLSQRRGALAGNRYGVYGRLDCPAALRALRNGEAYRAGRVFFADEETARAAGYRPCSTCMPSEYRVWRAIRAK